MSCATARFVIVAGGARRALRVSSSFVGALPAVRQWPLAARGFAAAAAAAPGAAAQPYIDLDESVGSLETLLASRPKVVTYYTAAWCGPCRAIAPVFSALAKENPDVAFVKIDIDSNPTTAEKAGISAVPLFRTFSGGKQSAQFSGANAATLKAAVATLVQAA